MKRLAISVDHKLCYSMELKDTSNIVVTYQWHCYREGITLK